MVQDRVPGEAGRVKGSIKEAIGKLTGDAKTQAEGRAEKATGRADRSAADAEAKARDATGNHS